MFKSNIVVVNLTVHRCSIFIGKKFYGQKTVWKIINLTSREREKHR